MNRVINYHVRDHQVAPSKLAAIFLFCPDDLNMPGANFTATLMRNCINPAAIAHGEDSGVQCTTWKMSNDLLWPAIDSIPRHFKHNQVCSLHVLFLCHGTPGNLIWSNGNAIPAVSVLNALKNLQFSQLYSVSLFACSSLKNVVIPRLPFDLIGFKEDIYWNELPFFSCRMIKEYCAGATLKEAVSVAKKACKHSSITPFSRSSVVFRSFS